MDKLDMIEIDMLSNLVNKEIEKIEEDGKIAPEQYKFDLRLLRHKLEVMRNVR